MSEAEEYKLPEGAELQPDGTVTYNLQWPIKFSLNGVENKVEQVTVRRKTLADNRAFLKAKDAGDVMQLTVTRLCGLEAKVADRMDEVDVDAIGGIVEGFSMPGRATGSDAPV